MPGWQLLLYAIQLSSIVFLGRVWLERGFSSETAADLVQRGHAVVADVDGLDRILFGKGQVILKDESGVLWGGSDSRADGMALGW